MLTADQWLEVRAAYVLDHTPVEAPYPVYPSTTAVERTIALAADALGRFDAALERDRRAGVA